MNRLRMATVIRAPRSLVLPLIALLVIITAPGRLAVAQGGEGAPPNQTTGEAPPPAAADAEPAAPQPIAAADIAPQADELSARVREIQKLAERSQDTIDIADKLSGTTQEVDRLVEDLETAPPVSLRSVSSAQQHWASLDSLFAGWQKTLRKRLTELQSAQEEIEAHRAVWQLTQSDELPQTVQQQIDSVLSDLDAASAAVKETNETLLTLQGQVSKQRDAASKATSQLDEIAESQRSRLFARDQDPLWRAFASDHQQLGAETGTSESTIAAALSEFAARYKTNFAVHAALFISLLILIWLTRRAVSGGSMSDQEIERVSVVLARPFSTALFVSLLIMRFIYPIAPAEVVQLGRLVFLIPTLRLLPTLMPKFRWMFGVLAIVFVAETAAQLAMDGSLLQRLVLLAATALAIVALGVGLAKDYRAARDGRTRTAKLIRVLAWLGALGLLGSLVANVLGAMSLANLLATAVMNAIWAAVALRVGVNVLSALLNLILRSPLARELQSVRDSSEIIYRRVVGMIGFGGVVLWIVLVLEWLQIGSPILAWCTGALEHEWVVGTLHVSVSGLVAFIVVVVIAGIVSRLIRFFLQEDILSRLSMPRGAPATISTLVHYTIIGIGLLVAFAASGLDLSKLGFIVGALGVGIGFGLQSIVNNFVSGLILIFERPIKVGDLIELTGTKGHVTRIGARACTVRTFAGAELIIPNGDIIASQVTNWTLSDQKRRTDLLIPVPLGSDARRVVEILESAASAQDDVLDDPAPWAAFESFEEQGMVFVVHAWPTVGTNPDAVRTTLAAASIEALREAGIDVPRPQREVLLTGTPPTPR
ncbi:MAG: mechanosensitive ion channel [Planctomycetes bacterium]|nr:mechanosensitive ion channel [Planctomycetota bacterium]